MSRLSNLVMRNQVQLITYVDRLAAGGLKSLYSLLTGPLKGVFGGIICCRFSIRLMVPTQGFDPIDHTLVDPDWGIGTTFGR